MVSNLNASRIFKMKFMFFIFFVQTLSICEFQYTRNILNIKDLEYIRFFIKHCEYDLSQILSRKNTVACGKVMIATTD